MPLNFPENPTPNQYYVYNGIRWRWNGYAWASLGICGGSDIALNENTNLSVSNNDTIKWGLSSAIYAEIEMQIKNASDGNAVLDTVYLYVGPP